MQKNFAIYIHIPYCVSKCHYCDFNSYGVGENLRDESVYVAALLREMDFYANMLNKTDLHQVSSIYFGGGTPSLFQANSIAQVITKIAQHFNIATHAEISLEMNPKTADLKKLKDFRSVGVNRISIGVQTLSEQLLQKLGRAHSADQALEAITWVQNAGFANYNVDLMYGLPGQNLQDLTDTLKQVLALAPPHVSAYSLIVEPETPFYRDQQRGTLNIPEEDLTIQMDALLRSTLLQHGLVPYEISNYAKPGFACLHNLHYWNYQPFLGLGAGAFGFLTQQQIKKNHVWLGLDQQNIYGYRIQNPKPPLDYCKWSDQLTKKVVEPIPMSVAQGEYWMMGLRKTEGIDWQDYLQRFQGSEIKIAEARLAKWFKAGYLLQKNQRMLLSEQGRMMSNEVMMDLIS